jgi:hypothetical protein
MFIRLDVRDIPAEKTREDLLIHHFGVDDCGDVREDFFYFAVRVDLIER